MFEVFQPVIAMILVSFAALFGSVISWFTKLEMESYKKMIDKWFIFLEILLLVVVIIGGIAIPCIITIILAAIGGILFYVLRKKNPIYRWIILGAILGFLFARDLNVAYIVSVFFVVFSFIYATVLNIPYILKKKKWLKLRLIEQVIFLISGVIVYFVLFKVF